MVDLIGQQFGDYQLIYLLGRGNFGEVYLGEHLGTHTQAAVKVLRTHLSNQKDLKEFINEARAFRLKHPHIVQLLDFGIGENDTPFLIMDYAPHGTLRQRHPKGSCLPLTTIVPYIKQIAPALQYAHDRKLVHRDVKPENMLIGRNNEILLSDFGIAIAAHNTTSLSLQNIAGTISYMAPEQINGQPRSASDQYALGVIVYEWLSGTRPFEGSSYIEIAMKHLSFPPPFLHNIIPSVLPTVEKVVLTALAKDPQQRFSSVLDFALALEQTSQPALQTSPTNLPHVTGHSPLSPVAPVCVISTPSISSHNTDQHGDFYPIPDFKIAEEPIIIERIPGPPHIKWRKLIPIVLVLLVLIATILFALRTYQFPISQTQVITSKKTPQASSPVATVDVSATATATTTSTQNPYDAGLKNLFLNEALNRNTASRWDETSGSCSFTPEGYQVINLAQSTTLQVCLTRNTRFSDLTFQVQMNILQGSGGGILFRSAGSIAYYFRVSQDRGYALFACTGASISCTIRLFGSISSWINNGQNQPNFIAVVAKGNRIELYINNERVAEVKDSSTSSGQIGVVADVNSEVVFRNAKVWIS